MKKFKEKVKSILKGYNAVISTPVVLISILLITAVSLMIVDVSYVASINFKVKSLATSMARQISIAGQIDDDTNALFVQQLEDIKKTIKPDTGRASWIVVSINLPTVDSTGTVSSNINSVATVRFNDSKIAFDETYNPPRIPVENYRKIQLGESFKLFYGYGFAYNSPFSMFMGPSSPAALSTATAEVSDVSQIYWKELDTTRQ